MARDVSPELRDRIFSHVLSDLEPSWLVVHTKVAIAAIIGGLLSLVVCGQFGFGLSSVANQLNHAIHSSLGPVPCAIVCGTLYAAFPIALLRFGLCPPMQFRAIMRRRWQALILWFAGFGTAMAFVGHHGGDGLAVAGWVAGAVIMAHLLARVVNQVAPAVDLYTRFFVSQR